MVKYFKSLNGYLHEEAFRPWKMLFLAFGILLLIAGSFYEDLPDWDIGVSIIMTVLTYISAPHLIASISSGKWTNVPAGMFMAWLSIDGSYCAYNIAVGHPYFREANLLPSTALYFLVGMILQWRGSLYQLTLQLRSLFQFQRPE